MCVEDARTAPRDGASTGRVGTFVSPGETLATISEETKQATSSHPILLVFPASSELLPNPHRGRVRKRSQYAVWDKFSNKMMSYICMSLYYISVVWLRKFLRDDVDMVRPAAQQDNIKST